MSDDKTKDSETSLDELDEIEEILGYDPNNKEIIQPDKNIQAIGKFSQSEFGEALIETYNIITVNGRIYIYQDGYYRQDERIIENKMIEIYPDIKTQQRSEVLNYIRIRTHKSVEDIKINPYVINLKNTRLNVKTGKILSFTPEAIEFDRIPVVYDPSAYNKDLDKMLDNVFLDDKEIRDLFGEMVGYCLIKNNKYEKGFLFTGSGSNGKSTILELLKTFLGERNYSSLELDKVTRQFSTALLENKLANIGDDINSKALNDTGTLKKLFSGQSLEVERKGIDGYTLRSHAKHIYSCNEIPKSYDKTDGFYRRWVVIPFNAKFSESDKSFDPLIGEKIVTKNALSYLLNIALEGATRLIKNKRFTKPEIVEKTLEEWKINNSLVLSWITDRGIDEDYLLSKPRDELYSEFGDWCKLSGIKEFPNKIPFNKEIYEYYNFSYVQKRIPGDSDRKAYYFIVKV